jgi:hypothetical protein
VDAGFPAGLLDIAVSEISLGKEAMMIRRTFIAAAAATFLCLAIAPQSGAEAQSVGRWERLGSREIGLWVDRDVIRVGANKGGFRKIKLNVIGNAIHVENVTVVYGNGSPDNIPLRSKITPGTDSRIIDLQGGSRIIRRIDLTLRSVRNGKGKARVTVWGRY